ncbi:MAG: 40S ribosomal protein S19, partial [Candidatus Woesearchaeota archaeon]
PIGVSKLTTLYGGKKNKGVKPEHFYKAGGNIIRKILQGLEKAQLVKQVQIGVHKGRLVTPKGKSLVDKAAQRLINGQSRRNKEAKA